MGGYGYSDNGTGRPGIALIGPGELIAFGRTFYDAFREFLAELIEVYGHLWFAMLIEPLGEAVGEEFPDALYVFVHDVGGLHVKFIHSLFE